MSDGLPPPPLDAAADDAELDLYCLECGYNLRGLSGDPRRCPECGHSNPVGELRLPAEEVQRQLRDIESAAVLCVAAAPFVIGGLLFFSWNGFAFFFRRFTGLGCFAVAPLFAAIWWGASVAIFRSRCFARSGWWSALLKYHLYGLTLLALVVGGFIGWIYFLWWLIGPWRIGRPPWTYYAGMLAFTVAVIFGLRTGLVWLHRRFRADTAFLEREVALLIARDRARWRMRGGRRRGWLE